MRWKKEWKTLALHYIPWCASLGRLHSVVIVIVQTYLLFFLFSRGIWNFYTFYKQRILWQFLIGVDKIFRVPFILQKVSLVASQGQNLLIIYQANWYRKEFEDTCRWCSVQLVQEKENGCRCISDARWCNTHLIAVLPNGLAIRDKFCTRLFLLFGSIQKKNFSFTQDDRLMIIQKWDNFFCLFVLLFSIE